MLSLELLIETPNMSSTDPFSLSSDLITELLRSMRLRGVQYRRIHAGAPYGLGFSDKPGHAYFHFVAAGSTVLRLEDGSLYELSAGNAVFIAHGAAHQLLSHAGAEVQDIDSAVAAPLGDTVCAVQVGHSADSPDSALLFSGCMEFELGSLQGLGRLMPGLMLIDAGGQRYPGLMPILATMEREVSAARIGFAGILARLADVVAAMIVRGWVECACGNASGLVAAARPTPGAGLAGPAPTTGARLERRRTRNAVQHLTLGLRRTLPDHPRHPAATLRHRTAHAPGQSVAYPGKTANRRSGAAVGLHLPSGLQSCVQADNGKLAGSESAPALKTRIAVTEPLSLCAPPPDSAQHRARPLTDNRAYETQRFCLQILRKSLSCPLTLRNLSFPRRHLRVESAGHIRLCANRSDEKGVVDVSVTPT